MAPKGAIFIFLNWKIDVLALCQTCLVQIKFGLY